MSNTKTNKASEEAKNPQEHNPYTAEQMADMRNKMKQFYEEELPFLRLSEEYEKLQADVEEHKVRKMTMMVRGAQMYAQMSEAEEKGSKPEPDVTRTDEGSKDKGPRKLKKD